MTTAYRGGPPSDPENSPADNGAAVECAARVAWSMLLPPSVFRACVAEVTSRGERYSRALFVIERRIVELRTAPFAGGRSRLAPLPDPRSVDPWDGDHANLASASEVVAQCPACVGQKKIACGLCAGSSALRCAECGGRGRVAGQRGMRNCGSCRGRGTVRCHACSKGRVDCTTCDASGRVLACLDVVRTRYSDVRAYPKCASADVHRGLLDPADFDVGGWSSPLEGDSGPLPGDASLPPELGITIDKWTERIVGVRMQTFAATARSVHVDFGGLGRSRIDVAGMPANVAPTSDLTALRRRRSILLAALGAASLAPVIAGALYSERHAFFATYGRGALFGWLVLAAGLLATVSLGAWTVRRWRHGRTVALAALGVAFSVCGAATITWAKSGPTGTAARAALEAGDIARAKLTAQALRDLHLEEDEGGRVLDEVRLRTTPSKLVEVLASLREPWFDPSLRQVARSKALSIAKADVAAAYQEGNLRDLEHVARLLADDSPETVAWAHGHAALLRSRRCSERGDFACAQSEVASARTSLGGDDARVPEAEAHLTKKMSDALAASWALSTAASANAREQSQNVQRAIELAEALTKRTGSPSTPAVEQLRAVAQGLQRRAEAEQAREDQQRALEAARERAEEAQRKRAEAAKEAAARAANRGIRCCDGTVSPSCMCQGSHRGCCSRHGGVCGCTED